MSPRRGRTCHTPQPPRPDRGWRRARTCSGRARAACARAAHGWPPGARRAPRARCAPAARRSASASRMRSSSPSVSRRGPPGAGTALCTAPCGNALTTASESWASSAAIWPRSCARAARSSAMPRTSRTSSMGASLLGATGVRKRLGAAEQRLLDVQRRHAGHRDGEQPQARAVARSGRRLGRDVAEEHRHRAGGVGHHARARARGRPRTRPPPAARPARAPRSPSGPSRRASSSAHTGTPVSTTRHEQRVLQRPARDEAALHQAVERRRLDRRALRIGIEADVAEEDAVGRAGPARGAGSARGRRGSGRPAAPGARAARSACAARAPARRTETSRSSGNSSASSRSTQPSSSAGSAPLTARSVIPRDSRSSAVEAPVEPGVVELADARGLHHAAGQRVGELRADGDAEEVGQDAVAVPGHREAPAVAAHERAQVVALAADRDGGHLQARMARAHAR